MLRSTFNVSQITGLGVLFSGQSAPTDSGFASNGSENFWTYDMKFGKYLDDKVWVEALQRGAVCFCT